MIRIVYAAAAALCLALPAQAATVITDWDAASGLPTTTMPAYDLEGAAGTIANGAMTINGQTYYGQDAATLAALDTSQGFSIEARLRYDSGYTHLDSRDTANIFFSQLNGFGGALFIGNDRFFINNGNVSRADTMVADTHDYHTYRIDLGAQTLGGAASVNVYYDGVLALTGTTYQSVAANGDTMRFGFGQASSYASGVSDWQFVRNVGAVPEPASWALMLAGFGGIGGAMRRRRVLALQ